MLDVCKKPRNAQATRQTILEAANRRFLNACYEQVGIREIACDAGVDAALVSRYFGSKSELYATVIEGLGGSLDIFDGPRADFGARAARNALNAEDTGNKLTWLVMMLRAASSPTASEILRKTSNTRFFTPLADWVGGEDAEIKAHLAASMLLGISIMQELSGETSLTPQQNDKLRIRLAEMLQDILDR